MTESQQKRAAFCRDLAALLRKHDADIDLRLEGSQGYSCEYIDLNVADGVVELHTRVDADILIDHAETLER